MEWRKIKLFEQGSDQPENWIFQKSGQRREFKVEVRFGKKIDITSLKKNLINDFAGKVKSIRASRQSIYRNNKNLERVKSCPVCGSSSSRAEEALNIYGASYRLCANCGHYYLLYRPAERYLNEFYKTNKEYQSTYADKRTLITRVKQVVIPKAEYVLSLYKRKYGKLPKKILDVGAGSGHFVYACKKLGLKCQGIEISESGRKFAKDNFNIELLDNDFFKDAESFSCDCVTFWGVIEHLSRPVDMLKASRSALTSKGMVVAEVPRWNCLSTAVHAAFPDSVVRHLDPMDHIQCFSDSSLATAFVASGLDIIAAWYFGMDAFELIMQLGYRLNDNRVTKILAGNIPIFQQSLDSGRLSDFMILTGVPQK